MQSFIEQAEQYKTVAIDDVMHSFVGRVNQMLLGPYIPLKFENRDKVQVDVDVSFRGGRTPLSARDAEAPLYEPMFGRAKKEMQAPTWKEKVRVTSSELYDERQLGTFDRLETVGRLATRKNLLMQERLANRFEYMRKDMIFNQRIIAADAQGNPVEYTFTQHPADFRQTAGVLWSTTATADPLDDLQIWAENFRDRSEFVLDKVVFPKGTFRQLQQIQSFVTIANQNFGAFNGSSASIKGLMTTFLGVGNIEESYHQIGSQVAILAPVAAGASNQIVVSDLHDIQVNQEITIHNVATMDERIHTVTAINAATKTLTLDRVLDHAVAFGDIVAWREYIVPLDKVLLLGRPNDLMRPMTGTSAETNSSYVTNWAEIISTRNLDHDMQSPVSGVWRKVLDKTQNSELASLEDIIGVNAMGRITYGRGWMVNTIY